MMMKGFTTLGLFFFLITQVSSKNFISLRDDRYPTYIVNDPRVKCTKVGSFPHPADCSWSYSCMDTMGLGFYRLNFQECEPGTTFSDDLDQCTYGTSKSCSTTTSPLTGTNRPVTVPEPPVIITTPATILPETETTTIEPDTRTTTIEPTTETPTISPPSPPPIPLCLDCSWKEICEDVQIKVCNVCRFEGGEYQTPEQQCSNLIDPHLDKNGQCIDANNYCKRLRQGSLSQQTIDEEQLPMNAIQCSENKLRPNNPQLRDSFCKYYHYCSSLGSYLVSNRLCSHFLQCSRQLDDSWGTDLRQCDGPYLYSFELDQCVPEPSDADLCRDRAG